MHNFVAESITCRLIRHNSWDFIIFSHIVRLGIKMKLNIYWNWKYIDISWVFKIILYKWCKFDVVIWVKNKAKISIFITYISIWPNWDTNTIIHWTPVTQFSSNQVMFFNSLRPSDGYIRWQTLPPLVQIMVCSLFGSKLWSEPMMEYC